MILNWDQMEKVKEGDSRDLKHCHLAAVCIQILMRGSMQRGGHRIHYWCLEISFDSLGKFNLEIILSFIDGSYYEMHDKSISRKWKEKEKIKA